MKQILLALSSAVLVFTATLAGAAVPHEAAARLGQELTPIGAIAAASADGTIPAWQGGEAPAPQSAPSFPQDARIDGDQPLFVITAANYAQYADHLSDGHKQLFARYKDYRMVVYPTRRTASYPQQIEAGSVANAAACELTGNDQPVHCVLGFPYPIPRSGAEAMWNHKLRWRGEAVERYDNQLIVGADGNWKQNRVLEQVRYFPVQSGTQPFELLRLLAHVLAPARIADDWLLVHEASGTSEHGRAAWVSKSSLKRAHHAPTLEYDTPYPDTDGMQFDDQVDMFSGDLNRYDWRLVGKKELYLPYNSNRIAGNAVKYRDLIRPGHLNQELARYELHRYWIVDAVLKPGAKHVYQKRRYYLDEDSWNVEAVDNFDAGGSLRCFQEGHLVHFAGPQVTTSAPQVIYDFAHGGYFVTSAFNEDRPPDFGARWSEDHFDPATFEKLVVR